MSRYQKLRDEARTDPVALAAFAELDAICQDANNLMWRIVDHLDLHPSGCKCAFCEYADAWDEKDFPDRRQALMGMAAGIQGTLARVETLRPITPDEIREANATGDNATGDNAKPTAVVGDS